MKNLPHLNQVHKWKLHLVQQEQKGVHFSASGKYLLKNEPLFVLAILSAISIYGLHLAEINSSFLTKVNFHIIFGASFER